MYAGDKSSRGVFKKKFNVICLQESFLEEVRTEHLMYIKYLNWFGYTKWTYWDTSTLGLRFSLKWVKPSIFWFWRYLSDNGPIYFSDAAKAVYLESWCISWLIPFPTPAFSEFHSGGSGLPYSHQSQPSYHSTLPWFQFSLSIISLSLH